MSTHIPSSQTTEDDSFRTVINEYQGFLFHQAMAPSNIESCLRRSRHFLIWLSRNGLGLAEVDGEVAARFQTHDCTCFGRSCARSKLGPARTAAGSSSSRVMWFVRFLELSGRTPTPGELEDNLARVPAFLHELRRQGYTQSRVDRFRYGATAFIAWLHLSRMRLRDIDADTLERFHHRRFACSIPGICWGRRSENERRYGPDIRRFLDHLADTGQIATAGVKWSVIGQLENVARKGDSGPVPSRQAAMKTVNQRDIEEDARRSPALPLRPFSCTFGTAPTVRSSLGVAPSGRTGSASQAFAASFDAAGFVRYPSARARSRQTAAERTVRARRARRWSRNAGIGRQRSDEARIGHCTTG